MIWLWHGAAAWGQATICLPETGIACDFASVSSAILAAEPEVPVEYLLIEGTFVENDLVLRNRRHVTLTGVGAVTVRASSAPSTFTVLDGSVLVVRGITLSNTNGRGARVIEGSRLELDDTVVFTVGIAAEGAGVLVQNSDLRVTESLFLDSSAVSRGGHISAVNGNLLIQRSRFVGGLAGDGGAIALTSTSERSAATLWDVELQDNLATSRGGGLFVEGPIDLTIVGGTFADNFAADGGAIAVGLVAGAEVDLSGLTFEGNEADRRGGALFVSASHAALEDVELIGNEAGDAGGAIEIGTSGRLTLRRALLCGNAAAAGGAIRTSSSHDQAWSNVRFVDNSAEQGGALDHASALLTLRHHSFLGNSAPMGSAVHSSAHLQLRDSLVAWQSGAIALVPVQGGLLDERYVLTWGNALGSRPPGVAQGPGGADADPQLRGYQPGGGCADIGDYHSWYGPLVDAGDPNEPRDPDGSLADIGPWGGPDASPEVWAGDLDGDGAIPLYDCVEGDAAFYPDLDPTDGVTHDTPYDGLDQDCDGGDDFDADGDGVPIPTDCDDADPETFPGAPEEEGQGDTNCDGLQDADGDGVEYGEDCNDSDPRIHPGVAEDPDPLVDRDCDGTGDVVRTLVPASCATVPGGWGAGACVVGALISIRRKRTSAGGSPPALELRPRSEAYFSTRSRRVLPGLK